MKSCQTSDSKKQLLLKRLAKYLALYCVRNTYLEDLHAGSVPDSACGDRSDVRVLTPTRGIPWPEVSRLDNAEMKRLMVEVVNRCYAVLAAMADEQSAEEVFRLLACSDPIPEWHDPDISGLDDVVERLRSRAGR